MLTSSRSSVSVTLVAEFKKHEAQIIHIKSQTLEDILRL